MEVDEAEADDPQQPAKQQQQQQQQQVDDVAEEEEEEEDEEEGVAGHRKQQAQHHRRESSTKDLTLDDLQAHFNVGLKEAAAKLGICATTLKRVGVLPVVCVGGCIPLAVAIGRIPYARCRCAAALASSGGPGGRLPSCSGR